MNESGKYPRAEPAPAANSGLQKVASTEAKSIRLPRSTLLNFWLDAMLAVLFVLLLGVTAVAQLIFPAGPAAEGWTLWGADLLAWRGLEFGLLCALGVGIILHVMLHWNWICQIGSQICLQQRLRPDDGRLTLYGVIVLMAILLTLGGLLITAEFLIRPPPGVEKVIVPGR